MHLILLLTITSSNYFLSGLFFKIVKIPDREVKVWLKMRSRVGKIDLFLFLFFFDEVLFFFCFDSYSFFFFA